MRFSEMSKLILEDIDDLFGSDKWSELNGEINWKPNNLVEKSLLDKIIHWLVTHEVSNFVINENGLIDIKGDLDLSGKDIIELKAFNQVDGNVNLSNNKLKVLTGFPKKVLGDKIDLRGNSELKGDDVTGGIPNIPDDFVGEILVDDPLKKYVIKKDTNGTKETEDTPSQEELSQNDNEIAIPADLDIFTK